MGELGFGLDPSPVFLLPGRHIINDGGFRFISKIDFTKKLTKLENMELVRVETGFVGILYRKTTLELLKPGLHLVMPPEKFGGFECTQMTVLQIPETGYESSDYVTLLIRAAVFYRIKDPLKARTKIKNIRVQIRDLSVSTLSGIIRGSTLGDIAANQTNHSYVGKTKT
eukprot:UN32645